MASPITLGNVSSFKESPSPLQAEFKKVSERCTNCEACQKDCQFLRKYTRSGDIIILWRVFSTVTCSDFF